MGKKRLTKKQVERKKINEFRSSFDFKSNKLPKAISRYKKADLKKLDRAVYQRIYRRRKAIDGLEKKKGWKAKRTSIYKEIVQLNNYRKYIGYYDTKELIRSRGYKKTVIDVKKGVKAYSYNVWQFEKILNDYIKGKDFKTIVFVNTGRRMYPKRNSITSILAEYDLCRDQAYSRAFATTPIVDVIEDYDSSVLTIEVIS